jgi:transposase
MERRKFTKEFKQEAVQLSYDSDRSIVEIAQNLGISPRLLYRWRSEQRQEGEDAFPGKGRTKPSEEEVRRLRRELEQVRMERDILKKALSVFARPER